MKINQIKRQDCRCYGDTGLTFPAAPTSFIRRAHHRAANDIHGPCAWQFARHALRNLFTRSNSSGQIGWHASVCTPARPT
jgi:hypothetical protein